MLKFILFTILFIYIAYKLSGFILKVFDTLLGRTGQRPNMHQGNFSSFGQKQQQPKYKQPANGNVNVEYIPEEESDKKKWFAKSFKGGEYIDYEEVKKDQ